MPWHGPNFKRKCVAPPISPRTQPLSGGCPFCYFRGPPQLLWQVTLGPHKRSKHFGIEWAYFKECVELGELTVVHVSTEEQPADMLTKSLAAKKFLYFRDIVMGDEKLQSYFEK